MKITPLTQCRNPGVSFYHNTVKHSLMKLCFTVDVVKHSFMRLCFTVMRQKLYGVISKWRRKFAIKPWFICYHRLSSGSRRVICFSSRYSILWWVLWLHTYVHYNIVWKSLEKLPNIAFILFSQHFWILIIGQALSRAWLYIRMAIKTHCHYELSPEFLQNH